MPYYNTKAARERIKRLIECLESLDAGLEDNFLSADDAYARIMELTREILK